MEDLDAFRLLLRQAHDLALAALLRELGWVLFTRQVTSWRVLSEISDELVDRVMIPVRRQLFADVETLLPPPPAAETLPRKPLASTRQRIDNPERRADLREQRRRRARGMP